MSHRERRIIIIGKMLTTIQNAAKDGLGVVEDKMIGTICFDAGITRRTAKEYVQILIDSGKILRTDGVLEAV